MFRMSDLDKLSVADLQAKKRAMGERTSPVEASRPKQLPSTPDPTALNASKTQSYGTFLTEYSLMAEYNLLMKKKLPGVYAIPSYKSPLVWFGVLFIRQGLYQEGVFKFTVYIPENYPDGECPRLIFDQCVYNPSVHPQTGELDVAKTYPKWRKGVNHLWEVLLLARRVFHKIETKDATNTDAAALYDSDLPKFREKVAETINLCKEKIYDPPLMEDPHAIRFSSWEPEVHEESRRKMLTPKERSLSCSGLTKNAQSSGLSWLRPDSRATHPEENGTS
ncbi:hypothetical protein CAPTEDRAFT_21008 [Capitella teleta]|uniref:UBC core domain-containing protein n=1 Tax=Capitella teleta TaxID=283909 RepID=R7T3S8_CAPTE|nr:hypothetical protein CAPTEDRAFT_21008 [Capitella teleta]|eukprot:ELT87326.1 hypothetical protein CAPTEDRAFT_21008 [Capitella teleta]